MVICNVRVAPHLRYWLVELFVWHVLSNSMTSKEWFHVGALSSIVGELSCIDYCRSCDRRCPEGASRHNQSRSRFIPNHLNQTVWVSSRAITTCAVFSCVVACVPLVLLEGACPASGALLSKCDPGKPPWPRYYRTTKDMPCNWLNEFNTLLFLDAGELQMSTNYINASTQYRRCVQNTLWFGTPCVWFHDFARYVLYI